jgi:hypothetical protein
MNCTPWDVSSSCTEQFNNEHGGSRYMLQQLLYLVITDALKLLARQKPRVDNKLFLHKGNQNENRSHAERLQQLLLPCQIRRTVTAGASKTARQ